MINITSRPLFVLTIMYYLFIGPFKCLASDEFDEEEKYRSSVYFAFDKFDEREKKKRLIPRKKPSSLIPIAETGTRLIPRKIPSSRREDKDNITLDSLMSSFQADIVKLQETSLDIVQEFPPKIRTERKVPPLKLTFEYEKFNWLTSDNYDDKMPPLFIAGVECLKYIYGQQLTLSCSEDFYSLGSMMNYLYKTGIQKKNDEIYFSFKQLECLFACTYQEIISYKGLCFSQERNPDISKISPIKKAICFYQVPVIVALSLAKNCKDACCKILILYDFDDNLQQFEAKEVQSNNKLNVSYLAVQLLALEAWVGYHSTLLTNSKT